MRNPGGYAVVFDPSLTGGKKEMDTFTCHHCSRIVHVNTPEDAGGMCKVCMKLICGPCVGKGTCTPWERKLEKIESRERARRSYGL